MGILDDAIREHLELKRKHGAREVEVQEMEQEAFGPSLQTGELPASPQAAAVSELVETAPETEEPLGEEAFDGEPPAGELGEEPPEPPAPSPPVSPQPPTQEFVVPEPPPPPPPGTEEHALPFGQPSPAPEAEVAPGEPGLELEPEPESESYEPPTEPTIEEPVDKIGESLSVITEGGSPTADFYDFDDEEAAAESPLPGAEFEPPEAEVAPAAPESAEQEPEYEHAEEGEAEEGEEGGYEDQPEEEEFVPEGNTAELFDVEADGDVLEETPEFLRERPDDDELWFEQRPPKDFDL